MDKNAFGIKDILKKVPYTIVKTEKKLESELTKWKGMNK